MQNLKQTPQNKKRVLNRLGKILLSLVLFIPIILPAFFLTGCSPPPPAVRINPYTFSIENNILSWNTDYILADYADAQHSSFAYSIFVIPYGENLQVWESRWSTSHSSVATTTNSQVNLSQLGLTTGLNRIRIVSDNISARHPNNVGQPCGWFFYPGSYFVSVGEFDVYVEKEYSIQNAEILLGSLSCHFDFMLVGKEQLEASFFEVVDGETNFVKTGIATVESPYFNLRPFNILEGTNNIYAEEIASSTLNYNVLTLQTIRHSWQFEAVFEDTVGEGTVMIYILHNANIRTLFYAALYIRHENQAEYSRIERSTSTLFLANRIRYKPGINFLKTTWMSSASLNDNILTICRTVGQRYVEARERIARADTNTIEIGVREPREPVLPIVPAPAREYYVAISFWSSHRVYIDRHDSNGLVSMLNNDVLTVVRITIYATDFSVGYNTIRAQRNAHHHSFDNNIINMSLFRAEIIIYKYSNGSLELR